MILFPVLACAEVRLDWKSVEGGHLLNEVEVFDGAFLGSASGSLILSTGASLSGGEHGSISNEEPLLVFWKDVKTSQWKKKISQIYHDLSGSAVIEHKFGLILAGGHNSVSASDKVSLLAWNPKSEELTKYPLPSLPYKVATSSAVIIEEKLYLYAYQEGERPSFYRLNLAGIKGKQVDNRVDISLMVDEQWELLTQLPIPAESDLKLTVQNDGFGEKVYGMFNQARDGSVAEKEAKAAEVWKFDPTRLEWQSVGAVKLAEKLISSRFNAVTPLGQSYILALMDDGKILSFNAITAQWSEYKQHLLSSESESKSSNTPILAKAVASLDGELYVLAQYQDGERDSSSLLSLSVESKVQDFGRINMTVLVVYLALVVMVGLFFALRNHNTNDYFRGGQSIPWWAAACSIYATMLSSLTYVALPAIVYQTNWILLVGIWMIIVVAPVGIYIAIPFFRQIDATSAYEYLSKRFNMGVRLFASALFTLFHIGRMGIVMALTALALSAVTPLTAAESVMIMGVLCLFYCTIGGIEAVIWTDTVQTIILLLGALVCFVTIISGIEGGISGYIDIGLSGDKFKVVDADFSLNSITTLSLWVIVIGGIGQNLTSYTADQAIVQRYMVTTDIKAAEKSIWANALIAGPASLLFFAIGTGLYAFYSTHPEKLDPNLQIDQIFPAFIATELPVGFAGLIVAGIFAAAQSTVSTSMNSIASTLVTDFIKPFDLVKTEKGYMSAARWLTFIMGALGTTAGLIFIDPEIRSLMEAYFKVIGMFMGALGGLFVLGVMTKKANATGAMIGILSGVFIMVWAWKAGWANGYLYATIGILSSFIIGYLVSLLKPCEDKEVEGLTLYTMKKPVNQGH
ncbi:sodium:solute symporter [Shewanella sp. NR704-98]|uniref:Sodium:solute symporter n=2 Tax=Shewanella nanhaiensis TaxID=2864872 RepID=A0ABS7E6P6_9GAMM|nr:sodium:solute symporter [Shewanella nanhaiensis]